MTRQLFIVTNLKNHVAQVFASEDDLLDAVADLRLISYGEAGAATAHTENGARRQLRDGGMLYGFRPRADGTLPSAAISRAQYSVQRVVVASTCSTSPLSGSEATK